MISIHVNERYIGDISVFSGKMFGLPGSGGGGGGTDGEVRLALWTLLRYS